MAFMKSLALAGALAISGAAVKAATITLSALPDAAVANPTASSTTGIVWQNVTGDIDFGTPGHVGAGDARSVWNSAGSTPELYASGLYSSVSAGASATFTFAKAMSSLSLVWGSVDPGTTVNNTIQFLLGDVVVATVTGADIFAAGFGGAPAQDSISVRIGGLSRFDSIILSDTSKTSDAFEFANLTAAVPLPAGGLMLISALGAVGLLRRRKAA